MYPIEVNTWYSCKPDKKKPAIELCKICLMTDNRYKYKWHIVTYYDGHDLFGGSLNDCLHWVNIHYCGEKYLQQFVDVSGKIKEG